MPVKDERLQILLRQNSLPIATIKFKRHFSTTFS